MGRLHVATVSVKYTVAHWTLVSCLRQTGLMLINQINMKSFRRSEEKLNGRRVTSFSVGNVHSEMYSLPGATKKNKTLLLCTYQHTCDVNWINNLFNCWKAAYLLFPSLPLHFQLQWEWRKIGGENWKFGLECRQPWLSAWRPVTSPRTTLCMAE